MTHSWPPPLTAIHTPGKADQTKFPIPNKVGMMFSAFVCSDGVLPPLFVCESESGGKETKDAAQPTNVGFGSPTLLCSSL